MQQKNHESIYFDDPDIQIKAVEAHGISDTESYLYQIGFTDSAGNEVESYNPRNTSIPTTKFQLGENEELIGVYGVKNKRSWLTSFGFIVKVTTETLD